MAQISIAPCNGPGAQIGNVDLSHGPGDAEFAAIKQAFSDHGLIFFRGQNITPKQHIAFARRWGDININRFFTPVEGYPEIAEVRKEPDQATNIGGGWHTDHSYDEEPAMGSILVARELPPKGGDTMFADMAAAYDALDEAMKAQLDGLEAVHSSKQIFGEQSGYKNTGDVNGRLGNADAADALDDVTHPVVITHPLSGKKILYVNVAFTIGIKGWSREDSMKLLMPLYTHAMQDRFVTRFKWELGSIAFWDNRATWHYALNDYHGERRLMHRITLEGCALH